ISGRFVKYLANALAGNMDPAVIFAVIGYRIPGFLELTLPLAFFLAILLTFGRLYVENEMSVLKACGISEGQLLGYTLIMGALLAVLVGWLSLYGSPAGAAKAETILKAQKEMTELDKVSPKKFYTLGGDKGVTYAERINDDRELEDVFLAITAGSAETFDSRLVVVVAESGKQQRSKDGEDRFLVLDSGYRFEGIPGNHNYQITYFEEYGSKLDPPQKVNEDPETDAIRTADLWSSNEAELRATVQWRLSTPFMVLVVVIMAVPLSRTNPRQGRFAKLLPAIMLYFAYLLSLNAIRGNIESGDYPAGLTLIPVHLLFLLMGVFLVNSERFRIFQRIVALRRMKFS
ncbi:LPS export ABC transporter permease LptF, partial [Porticoccaceae bacterium]|nr:LPS export ABC transporter permease LptF [Porticoccaceae bacterium]